METSITVVLPVQPSKLRAQTLVMECKHLHYQSFYVRCFVLKVLMFVALVNALCLLGELTHTGQQRSSRSHSFTQRALSHVLTYLSVTSSA